MTGWIPAVLVAVLLLDLLLAVTSRLSVLIRSFAVQAVGIALLALLLAALLATLLAVTHLATLLTAALAALLHLPWGRRAHAALGALGHG